MKKAILSFVIGAVVTAGVMGGFWYHDREQYTRTIPAVSVPPQLIQVANGTQGTTTNGTVSQQAGQVAPQQTTQQVQITQEKAIEIFKAAYPDYRIEKVKFDTDHGRAHYEIDGETMTRDVEIKIDAITGEIFAVKEDH